MTRGTLSHRFSVAVVCRSLDGGGAEGVMVALADAFARIGHDVSLVLLCRGSVDEPRPSSAVRVVTLDASSVARATTPFVRWLREARPDAVLSTLVAPNLLAVASARLLPRAERPRVVVREANTLTAALRFRPAAFGAATRLAVRAAYPRADAIVAVSSGAADDLARVLGVASDRIVTIPNPALGPDSARLEAEPVAHPWFADHRAVPVVIAAGRLVEKKGFDLLLTAFSRVTRRCAARLVILGEGPLRAQLERKATSLGIADVAILPGFQKNPLAWFARADLFVLSSFAEGMPNAMLQAMAAGCPIVATDCPSGPREILDGAGAGNAANAANASCGRLVPPGDADALADAMLASLRAPPPRSRSRERAKAYAIDAIAERYDRLLHR